jgi:hypothetical protein
VRALILVGALAAAAHADSSVVFPLSAGKLPTALANAPEKMTDALAHAIDAEVGAAPIEDAAGLLGCDPEATTCIESVSKSVKANRIVFGSISADADGAVKVTLTRFDPGPDRQQRTFELSSSTADALADELVRVSAPLFGGAEPDPIRPDPPKEDPPNDDPPTIDAPAGPISTTTWAVLGGGAIATTFGVVFLVQASSIADEVRAAPRETPQDFERLTALEDKGQLRQRLGIAFTAFGAVGLGYGIYRLMQDRKAHPTDRSALRVTPVPLDGGAALVFTMGVP